MAGGSFPRQAELVADLGDDSAPGDRPRALTGSCQDRVASWSWHGAWKGENLVPGSAGAQGVCGSESTWKGREGGEQYQPGGAFGVGHHVIYVQIPE